MDGEKMKITIVGSGTVFLNDGRSQSCVLVEAGGESVVFDLGSGAMRRMLSLGHDPLSLDRIFLTHFHPDHTAEIVPLLFSMNYGTERPRSGPLYLSGPRPFLEFWDSLPRVWAKGVSPHNFDLDLSEFPLDFSEPLSLPGFGLSWTRAQHRPESISYRLDGPDGAFVYTGDTEYCESVVELSRGYHTVLAECSGTDEAPIAGHMTPSSVARLARESGVERLVVTHVFPATRELDLVSEIGGRGFEGEIVLAEDGTRLEV